MLYICTVEVKRGRIDLRREVLSENRKEFFERAVATISAIFTPKKFWLTDRETELFVSILLCRADGIRDFMNPTVIKERIPNFKDRKTMQVWIPNLVKKGWLIDKGNFKYEFKEDLVFLLDVENVRFSLNLMQK